MDFGQGFTLDISSADGNKTCVISLQWGDEKFVFHEICTILSVQKFLVLNLKYKATEGRTVLVAKVTTPWKTVDAKKLGDLRSAVNDLFWEETHTLSSSHSIMEVVGARTIGNHFRISHALTNLGITIDKVHMSTSGNRFRDVFFLSCKRQFLSATSMSTLKQVVFDACHQQVRVANAYDIFPHNERLRVARSNSIGLKFGFLRRSPSQRKELMQILEGSQPDIKQDAVMQLAETPEVIASRASIERQECVRSSLVVGQEDDFYGQSDVTLESRRSEGPDGESHDLDISIKCPTNQSLLLDLVSLLVTLGFSISRLDYRQSDSDSVTDIKITEFAGPVDDTRLRWLRRVVACVGNTPCSRSLAGGKASCSIVEYVAERKKKFFGNIMGAFVRLNVRIEWGRVETVDERSRGNFFIADYNGYPFSDDRHVAMLNDAVLAAIADA